MLITQRGHCCPAKPITLTCSVSGCPADGPIKKKPPCRSQQHVCIASLKKWREKGEREFVCASTRAECESEGGRGARKEWEERGIKQNSDQKLAHKKSQKEKGEKNGGRDTT